MSTIQEWYYKQDDQKQGPLTANQLKGLASTGGIAPTTLVWTKGLTEWREARRVKGLLFPAPEPEPAVQKLATPRSRYAKPAIAFTACILCVVAFFFFFFFNGKEIEKPQPRLQGSVFVVKGDGESVRLGLTDVYLVPSADATEELIASINEILKHIRSEEHSIDYYSRPSNIGGFSSPQAAQRNRNEQTNAAISNKLSLLIRLDELRSLLVVAAVDHTKTDADGEFELAIPAGVDASIVAYATRKINAQSEHYFWIIPAEEAMQQKRFFLSNDNQIR